MWDVLENNGTSKLYVNASIYREWERLTNNIKSIDFIKRNIIKSLTWSNEILSKDSEYKLNYLLNEDDLFLDNLSWSEFKRKVSNRIELVAVDAEKLVEKILGKSK